MSKVSYGRVLTNLAAADPQTPAGGRPDGGAATRSFTAPASGVAVCVITRASATISGDRQARPDRMRSLIMRKDTRPGPTGQNMPGFVRPWTTKWASACVARPLAGPTEAGSERSRCIAVPAQEPVGYPQSDRSTSRSAPSTEPSPVRSAMQGSPGQGPH